MQLGMIGLGRMGANMVRRLMKAGHECVVYDRNPAAVRSAGEGEGDRGRHRSTTSSRSLKPPRAVWLMVPAAVVDATLERARPQARARATSIIDGGNSYYIDDIRRAKALAERGIHYVDAGTSGGVWGLERGYCLMIGGPDGAVERLDPHLQDARAGPRRRRRARRGARRSSSTAEEGYLHCGPNGAGHFVKMVHNGIEYGLMAAYAEGFNILRHANVGKRGRAVDAETTPLRNPEHYQYDLDLRRHRRGVAARQRGRLVAARPDRHRAARAARPRRILGPRVGLRRGPLDHQRRDRRGRARAGADAPRCSSASARAARPTSRTRCSRRCAFSSAATSRRPTGG